MNCSLPSPDAGQEETGGVNPDNRHADLTPQKPCCRLSAVFVGVFGLSVPVATALFFASPAFWQQTWRDLSGRHSRMTNPAAHLAMAQAGPSFDFSELTVPKDEVHAGGPPKDGIPALSNPRFVSAAEAKYLRPQDRVIGYVSGDQARAYPLKILNFHEIVNDKVANVPIAVTYCPLCDSCAVFDRRTPLGERDFGVSGLLHDSNVLMYDRGGEPESLWSQVMAEGISGPGAKKSLTALPAELTTWADWRSRYPNSEVLSINTGHRRDYDRNPYQGYFTTPRLAFPAKPLSDRLPTKARVLGVWVDNMAKAYPESAFGANRERVEDTLGEKKIVIKYNPQAKSMRVAHADEGIQWMYSLWFAWHALRPSTEVFEH